MNTIEAPGPELSIPTPIQYQVERIIAPKRTRAFPDDADPAVIDKWVEETAAWQDAWLTRRENEVRANYGMKPRIANKDPLSHPSLPPVQATTAFVQATRPATAWTAPRAQAAPPAAPYPPGVEVAAALRLCSDPAHNPNAGNGRERGLISSAEWDFSHDKFGRPLCRPHQEKPTRKA